MKNLFKILVIAFIGMWMVSCEKDEDQAVLGPGTDPVVSVDKQTIVLSGDNVSETAASFNWKNSDYGVNVALSNELQFALKGTGFSPVKTVAVENAASKTMTVGELNNVILSLGVTTVTATDVEVRLKSSIADRVHYSNVISLKVTPFINGPVYTYTDLYLIGDATAGAWDNTSSNAKIYPLQKTASSNVYTYTGFFAQGGFKMIKTPGSWDAQYGMGSSAGTLSTSGASGNITVTGSGYYKLTVDTTALTYTFTPVTPPTVTYTTISMIGTASGTWDTDLDMDKSTFDPHVWVKKNVMLNSGEFKFRADHAWTTSWGIAQEFFGIAAVGGGNIPVTTSFHYNVYFNDMTGEFSVIPVN